MKTIAANVEFLEVSNDMCGPIIFVSARAINDTEPLLILRFYLNGPAAEKLKSKFYVGCEAAVEIAPCLGTDFGRLVRIGYSKMPCGPGHCALPVPFGDLDEYEEHFFIHQWPRLMTLAFEAPPPGYKDPFVELQSDEKKDEADE